MPADTGVFPGASPGGPSPLELVTFQAEACARAGSPLYARILDGVAADLRRGGPSAALLATGGETDPFGSALVLRLLAAVHRLVLDGDAPELAAGYPSAGGGLSAGDPVPPFLRVLEAHGDEIRRRLPEGLQTNEVGRSAVLVGGFSEIARWAGWPLRVLEVGASAGLNLRWDHYAYDTGRGVIAGAPDSPVRFEGVWRGPPPDLLPTFEVAERRGCDRNPIDATDDESRRRLRSFVWPDQLARLARLDAALEVAARVPVTIDAADAADWTGRQLATPAPETVTVVVHSIVLQYLAPEGRRAFVAEVVAAGRRATDAAPLAWLRMEPAGDRAELRCTFWPDGRERVLATAGFHGQPIWWASA